MQEGLGEIPPVAAPKADSTCQEGGLCKAKTNVKTECGLGRGVIGGQRASCSVGRRKEDAASQETLPLPPCQGKCEWKWQLSESHAESEVPDYGPLLHSTLSLLGAQGQGGWS